MHIYSTPLDSILQILKSQCGIKQAKVAKDLGISPQALTDMKAGRRRFTPDEISTPDPANYLMRIMIPVDGL